MFPDRRRKVERKRHGWVTTIAAGLSATVLAAASLVWSHAQIAVKDQGYVPLVTRRSITAPTI